MKSLFTIGMLATMMSATQAGTLDDIASLDILGSQRAYVESKLGPAQKVYDNERHYKWKQCAITIYEQKKTVTGVLIDHIGKGCDFDTGRIGLQGKASAMTFGKFLAIGPANADEACLSGCGNAAEPEYSAHLEGAHYQQFTQYTVSTTYAKSERILDAFRDKVKKKTGIDDDFDLYGEYLGSKISQDAYDQLFFYYFKNIPITSIRFNQ